MPWHDRNAEGIEKEVPFYPGLPTKRTPIKGKLNYSGQLLIDHNSVACAQNNCGVRYVLKKSTIISCLKICLP